MTVFFGIGVTGRFGNQIIEYMICKYLEHLHGIPIYHSHWMGTEFYQTEVEDFHLDSITVTSLHMDSETYKAMKFFRLHYLKMKEEINPSRKDFFDLGSDDLFFSKETVITNKVIFHQPKVHMTYLNQQRTFLRSLFHYKPHFTAVINKVKQFVGKDKKLVVLHIRKGDFDVMLNPYCVFVDHFYIQWLNENFNASTMSLYVCGHLSHKLKKSLEKFYPLYLNDILNQYPELNSMHPHVDIAIDHGIMRKADIILTSNSTFSFTASLISENDKAVFYKQNFDLKKLVPFDPWNSDSFELHPFGLKWFYLYFKYNPLFGFKFFIYIFRRLLKGKKLIDISYT